MEMVVSTGAEKDIEANHPDLIGLDEHPNSQALNEDGVKTGGQYWISESSSGGARFEAGNDGLQIMLKKSAKGFNRYAAL